MSEAAVAPTREAREVRAPSRAGQVLGAVARALVVLALGLVVGLAVVATHQWWAMLAVGTAAALAVLLALPRAWWSRPPFVVGFAVVVALGAVPRSEGDYVVGADAPGWTLLAVTLALVLLTVATLPRPQWRHEPPELSGPHEPGRA